MLTKPADLGRGGATLNWGYFAKNKPVLTITQVDYKQYLAIWYGFFDEQKNIYIWSNKSGLSDGLKGPKEHSFYLYECQNEKDIERLMYIDLEINGEKKHNDFLVVIKQMNDNKKLRAFINSQHRIVELKSEFSHSTTINNIRFIGSQQILIALFHTEDNKWVVNYCWDISANNLFFAAKKKGSKKKYYSRNIDLECKCTTILKAK